MAKLANYLGKTIFVSTPKSNGDGLPHPFKLVGLEEFGLWLEEGSNPVFPPRDGCNQQAILVPFAQIAYIMSCGPASQGASSTALKRETGKPLHKAHGKDARRQSEATSKK